MKRGLWFEVWHNAVVVSVAHQVPCSGADEPLRFQAYNFAH